MEGICSQDPLESLESPPVKPYHPSRQRRLSEERCMKAHATRMQVFLQANSLANPKQQALDLVFCFWGTRFSAPDPTPPASVPRVSFRVTSALIRICFAPPNRRHSLNLDNSLWLTPAPRGSVCTRTCVWTKEAYLHLTEGTFMMLSPSHTVSSFQLQNLCYYRKSMG